MPKSNYVHSFPSWIAGPRALHPKFGGGIVVGGIVSVEDRLLAIKRYFPDDYSSGHIFLEVRAAGGLYEALNRPEAIGYNWLVESIQLGVFPQWSAFTSPAFGIPGLENGAILNPDSRIREMAHAGHCLAIRRSRELKKKGLGLGHTIWWPARDSRLHRGLLSEMSVEDGQESFFDFWFDVSHEVGKPADNSFTMLLEYKPSIPGDLDFIPTMKAAITFCKELNRRIGWKFMGINLEWAHALIGGQTVEEATRMQLDAGLFGGLVHVNSAQLAIIEWNETGTGIVDGTPGEDFDWAVGEGNKERWQDQQEAIQLLLASGIPITFEHDIDPMGEDPMDCYGRSRENLEKMILAVA